MRDVLAYIMLAWIVAMPALGTWRYRRLKRLIAVNPNARLRFYRLTLVTQTLWSMLVILWARSGPGLAAIGLAAPRANYSLTVRVAIVGGVIAFVLLTSLPFLSARGRQLAIDALKSVRDLLPHGPREKRFYAAVAVGAGVSEELLFRGFLMLLLIPPFGLYGALAAQAVWFGFAHLYQGPRGVILTGCLGALFALSYVATGSLWLAIALHAIIDLRILVLPVGEHASAAKNG